MFWTGALPEMDFSHMCLHSQKCWAELDRGAKTENWKIPTENNCLVKTHKINVGNCGMTKCTTQPFNQATHAKETRIKSHTAPVTCDQLQDIYICKHETTCKCTRNNQPIRHDIQNWGFFQSMKLPQEHWFACIKAYIVIMLMTGWAYTYNSIYMYRADILCKMPLNPMYMLLTCFQFSQKK